MADAKAFSNINISHVLRTIWMNKGISRTEIADILSLNKSTISKIVSRLLDMGIIETIKEGEAGPLGGRKPIHLQVNRGYGYVLGIEIETDEFTAVALNFHGEKILSRTGRIKPWQKSLTSVFFEILSSLNETLEEIPIPLIGIGIGMPGIIDPHEGIIYQSKPMQIGRKVHFYDEVSKFVKVPLLIEKDANCMCWSELAFLDPHGKKNFLCLLAEFRRNTAFSAEGFKELAVGLGFVINASVHYGEDYFSGEFQSIFHQEEMKNSFGLSDREMTAAETDPLLFEKLSRELGKHIAILFNPLNLSRIVIGGNVQENREDFKHFIEEEVYKNWPYEHGFSCEIRYSPLGKEVVAYGAASMFIEKIFSFPELTVGSEKKILTGIELLHQIHDQIKR
jgi:predicted NBD/HSP70 family sugar kinase